jgi:hypothetical protein
MADDLAASRERLEELTRRGTDVEETVRTQSRVTALEGLVVGADGRLREVAEEAARVYAETLRERAELTAVVGDRFSRLTEFQDRLAGLRTGFLAEAGDDPRGFLRELEAGGLDLAAVRARWIGAVEESTLDRTPTIRWLGYGMDTALMELLYKRQQDRLRR